MMDRTKAALKALEDMANERSRMSEVLHKYDAGELPVTQLPPDAHRYYGRIRAIDEAISELGKGPHMAQERDRETDKLPEILTWRRHEILLDVKHAEPLGAIEEMAAMNYLHGRADEYNGVLEAVRLRHPHLQKDLPAAIAVDEIVVRQRTQEQERGGERSLANAR